MTRIGIADAGFAYDGAELAVGEAHLWIAPDGTCLASEDVPSLLPPDERAKAAGFISEKAARSFVAGRVLTRLALSRHCPVRPQDWVFAPGLHGRPFIAAPEKYRDIQFSISHTEGMVACLTSRTVLAAVDVERVAGWEDLPTIAPTILSAEEQRCIGKLTGDAWLQRFFEYWTLKEAYAKALGVGLACDFRSMSFDLRPPCAAAMRFADGVGDVASDWLFRRLEVGPDHVGAVAIKSGTGSVFRLLQVEVAPDLLGYGDHRGSGRW